MVRHEDHEFKVSVSYIGSEMVSDKGEGICTLIVNITRKALNYVSMNYLIISANLFIVQLKINMGTMIEVLFIIHRTQFSAKQKLSTLSLK